MKKNRWKITSKKSALFSKIMNLEVQVIYMKMCTQKFFSYLLNIHTLQMMQTWTQSMKIWSTKV